MKQMTYKKVAKEFAVWGDMELDLAEALRKLCVVFGQAGMSTEEIDRTLLGHPNIQGVPSIVRDYLEQEG